MNSIPKKPLAAICTIEKANGFLNQLIEEQRLSEVGLIIVDELHMIGDGDRGALLEILLAKARYMSKGSIQIIGTHCLCPLCDVMCRNVCNSGQSCGVRRMVWCGGISERLETCTACRAH